MILITCNQVMIIYISKPREIFLMQHPLHIPWYSGLWYLQYSNSATVQSVNTSHCQVIRCYHGARGRERAPAPAFNFFFRLIANYVAIVNNKLIQIFHEQDITLGVWLQERLNDSRMCTSMLFKGNRLLYSQSINFWRWVLVSSFAMWFCIMHNFGYEWNKI